MPIGIETIIGIQALIAVVIIAVVITIVAVLINKIDKEYEVKTQEETQEESQITGECLAEKEIKKNILIQQQVIDTIIKFIDENEDLNGKEIKVDEDSLNKFKNFLPIELIINRIVLDATDYKTEGCLIGDSVRFGKSRYAIKEEKLNKKKRIKRNRITSKVRKQSKQQ